jgi:hypothetical protein
MGVKISDVAAKGSSDGTELIAVSDSLTAKSITTANIKTYTIDQIEAIAAAGSTTGADSVYILQGGVLKPVDIDLVAQHAIDTIWGKALEAAPAGADTMALKDDGAVEKTITLTVLAEFVRATIEAAILDISDLADGSGALAGTDYLLVTQGTTGKQVTVQDLIDDVYDDLAAHVIGLAAAAAGADANSFYVIQGGAAKEMTLLQLKTYMGNFVTGPGTTTENNIPQWDSTDDVLKNGLTLATATFDDGLATAVATTAAIRDELDRLIFYSGYWRGSRRCRCNSGG